MKMKKTEEKTNLPVPVKSTALATDEEEIEYVDAEPIDPEQDGINVPPIQMEINISDAFNAIDIWGMAAAGAEHEMSTYFFPAEPEWGYISDEEDVKENKNALEKKDGKK